MANLFIGFPVPRAKIADMIAGEAPPLQHGPQHEKDGNDEIDATGLVGAGGVAFPLRGIWIDDYNADHARWYKAYTGGGELTRSYDTLTLRTTDTNPSTARLHRIRRQSIVPPTWAKKRHLIFQAYFDADDKDTAEFSIQTGYPPSTNSIGFDVSEGKLWTLCRNSGGDAWGDIKTFSDSYIGEDLLLEAIFFPAEKVEFWLNGVLEHTETNRLPSGTTDAEYIFYIKLDNNSTGNNVQLDFSQIQVYQEA